MRMNQAKNVLLSIAIMVFGHWGTAGAYEEMAVADGGTLTGSITLSGPVPKPKGYNLVTFPDPVYCGRISDGKGWRLLQAFKTGQDDTLNDVVIVIEGIERGKPLPEEPQKVEAIDCLFNPFVTVVRDRTAIEVVNMDPVMHDIQAYETSALGPRVLFNVPLPMNPHHPRETPSMTAYHKHLPGEPIRQVVKMTKGRRAFVMQCGFHAYMESWGLAVEHPYYAVSGPDGRFMIADVPPGTYGVTVWHPRIGETQYEITIGPKGTTTLGVALSAPTGRLYANEAVENPRFGLGIMGTTEIVPTLEKQAH